MLEPPAPSQKESGVGAVEQHDARGEGDSTFGGGSKCAGGSQMACCLHSKITGCERDSKIEGGSNVQKGQQWHTFLHSKDSMNESSPSLYRSISI